ncbi:hypothetical protein [Novosphingobium terrae]|jgi:hypothetical protein|nr:hypothetical protein [Novosphingobium terrae]
MTKENPKALHERGTLVRCMGRGGVVVASSGSAPGDHEDAARNVRQMA